MKTLFLFATIFYSVCFCSNESYWDLKKEYSQEESRIQSAQKNLNTSDPLYQEKISRLSYSLKEISLRQLELEVNYQHNQLTDLKEQFSDDNEIYQTAKRRYDTDLQFLSYQRKQLERDPLYNTTLVAAVTAPPPPQKKVVPVVEETQTRQTRVVPSYLSASFRGGRGIGYKQNYSSLDLFLTPSWDRQFQPFLDFRGHVFNDGRMASNLGAGMRFITEDDEFALGVNVYHDFRATHDLKAHQLGFGLEGLFHYLDVRINGYFPIANDVKIHPIRFHRFTGNFIEFKRRAQIAYSSANAEIGIPIPMCGKAEFYLATGPYYLWGRNVNQLKFRESHGWQGRVTAKFFEYFEIELAASHDNIFHRRAQVQASLSIPLGKRPPKVHYSSCAKENFIARTKAPAMRHEIIPMKKKESLFFLDDAEGDLLVIMFVNNLAVCPGSGTFENPFCTLALAEATSGATDVIYVFEGNGTSSGYNTGITLKEGQRLQGSGFGFNFNRIFIPSRTAGNPTLTNTGGDGVTLASNTIVDGMTIVQPAPGPGDNATLGGRNVTNTLIQNNTFQGTTGGGSNFSNVYLIDARGVNTIQNNIFTGNITSGIGVWVDASTGSAHLTLQANNFTGLSSDFGIYVDNQFGPGTIRIAVRDNSFGGATGATSPDPNENIRLQDLTINPLVDGNTFIGSNAETNIHVVRAPGATITDNVITRNNLPAATAKASILVSEIKSGGMTTITDNTVTTLGAFTDVHGIEVAIAGTNTTSAFLDSNVIATGVTFGIHYLTAGSSQICTELVNNTAPHFLFTGAASAQINIQSTQMDPEATNFATPATNFTYIPVVNFNSSCTFP